ncbi:hypothetical protein OJ998_22990 [Solirubrobacter taibaiensis]|nr:hypothetical protein [Solirubrobacter taibaiensis]
MTSAAGSTATMPAVSPTTDLPTDCDRCSDASSISPPYRSYSSAPSRTTAIPSVHASSSSSNSTGSARSGRASPVGTGTVATTSDTCTYAYRFHGPTCHASAGTFTAARPRRRARTGP